MPVLQSALLACEDLVCERPLWRCGPSSVRGVSTAFEPGCLHAIVGPEGCGKNLLLHTLALLEKPDAGEVWINGRATSALSAAQRDELRQREFGCLFPASGILPALSVLENIAMPLVKDLTDTTPAAREATMTALEFCGLTACAGEAAGDLDPPQQPLVAFARAIIHRPRLLVAESPADESLLLPLAARAVREFGLTVLWAGDSVALERCADRVIRMESGRLLGDPSP